MKASKLTVPVLYAFAGFGVGAFVYFGPYSYATADGTVVSRVNRITGVERFASSHGWVTRGEGVRAAMAGGLQGVGDAFQAMNDSSSSVTSAPSPSDATAGSLGPSTGKE